MTAHSELVARLMHGELVSVKNLPKICSGDTVKRVNVTRMVQDVVGRYCLRLVGEDQFWDVRAPLRPVTFVERAKEPQPDGEKT
jgi:hypothetical protein